MSKTKLILDSIHDRKIPILDSQDVEWLPLKAVVGKLPHLEARFPDTYSYDYLRSKTNKFQSRHEAAMYASEHASMKEIYSTALMQILQERGVEDIFTKLTPEDLKVCSDVAKVAHEYVKKIESAND